MKSKKEKTKSGAETKRETKQVRETRGMMQLNIGIYICGVLVIVGPLWLGYLGVFGHLKSQKMLGLCVLFGTLFFVWAGGFLYFLQQLSQSSEDNTTQRSFTLLDRPYVGIDGIVLTAFEAGKKIQGVVRFKNSGHTPALHVTALANVYWEPAKNPTAQCMEPFDLGPPDFTRSTVGIGVTKETPFSTHATAAEEDIRQFTSGRSWFYVYAIIRYEGSSGEKYFTEYYARYNPGRNVFDECGTHNDAN